MRDDFPEDDPSINQFYFAALTRNSIAEQGTKKKENSGDKELDAAMTTKRSCISM
ncbi:MAG: hypothetical protein ISR61_10250 [Desulfobacteraceae bacterium]|nr:hypothetical protein [Desulfobacteraceae bacterium]